jgi:hypothetical protein
VSRTTLIETAISVVMCAALLAHMLVCFIAAGPDNYIKLEHDVQINQYVSRLFGQSWGFFAPEPIASNLIVVVRGASVDGKTTGWIDVSDALIDQLQANRLSSYELITTSVSNAVGAFENNKAGGKLQALGLGKDLYREVFFRIITRTGASILEEKYPGRKLRSIQIGIIDELFPRFTRRFDGDDKSKAHMELYKWMPAPQVTAI